MLTNRIATLVLLAVLGGLLGADKEPAAKPKFTSDGTKVDRIGAAVALGGDDGQQEIRDAKTVDGWVDQALTARAPRNRRRAITTLDLIAVAAVESNEAIPDRDAMAAGLVKCLADKDAEVRASALTALQTCATEASIPALSKSLKTDADELNRMGAAAALASTKGSATVGALEAAAKSKKETESVRRAAIQALGKVGPDAKSALESLTKSVPNELSEDVDKALDRVEGLGK